MSDTVVVGYDGSPCADAALDVAVDLALRLPARLVIAYAAAPPYRSVGEEYREHRNALEEIGDRATQAALARARQAGADAEAVLVDDSPASGLLELARARGAAMIVVGTTGESPLTGAILGSVPFKLLHRSRVPVLVVPVPE